MKNIIFGQLNKEFFEKHQKIILFVSRFWLLKWIVGTNRLPKELKKLKVDKILPSSVHYKTGMKFDKNGRFVEEWKMCAFTRPRFAESLSYYLYPFWRLCHLFDMQIANKLNPAWNLGFDSASYYAGAGDGRTVCDVQLWDTAHDATTAKDGDGGESGGLGGANYTTDADTSVNCAAGAYRNYQNRTVIGRGFFPINTGDLPDGATISAATLYLYVVGKNNTDNDGYDYIVVVQTTQASTSELVADDYDQCGDVTDPTQGSNEIDLSSITTSQYNEWALNATGLTWISKTGWTKLGTREGNDAEDQALSYGENKRNGILVRYSEYTGTGSDPYLSVTYTVLLTKTLTEVVKARGTIIKGTQKVLLSALAVVSKKISQIGHTIQESFILREACNRASTFYKTFVESIINSDAFEKVASFYKTLTEAILASDTFSKIQNLTRTLSESLIIKDAREKVLTAYKTLIENIKASDLYEKSASLFKLLSEALTTSDLSVAIKKQFFSTLTEVVQVVDKISFTTTRFFTETILVNAQKLTQGAFSFIENIVTGSIFGKLPTKRLLENIKASDLFIPNKIQKAILTDTLNVVSGFTRSISRNFFETINVIASFFTTTTKIFTETIVAVENFVALFGHVLLEKIIAVGSLASWSIGKLIVQSLKVIDSVGKASAWLMSEVIKVSENFVATAHKVLTEIINVVSSMRFAMGKIFTHVIRVDNIRIFNHIFYTIKTESLKVLDTITHGISRTFNEIVIVIGAIGSWSIAKLFIEPIKVVASFLRTWTLSRVFTEVIKGGSEAYQQSIKIFRETINVISSTIIPVPAKVFYETLKVVQNITKSLPKTFEEVVSVTGNMLNQTGKTFVEAINVVGTFVLGTISKLFIEVVKVAHSLTNVGTFYKLFSEAISVTEQFANRAGKIFAETIEVVGQFVLGTISKLFIETIKIVETYARTWTLSRVFSETINAVELYSTQIARTFTELINVVEQGITRLTGRLFTEHIGIDWGKIKLVLNGIQVGLWKKVARITNGVWKKVSRNDTL
jgi:hypothetical protein